MKVRGAEGFGGEGSEEAASEGAEGVGDAVVAGEGLKEGGVIEELDAGGEAAWVKVSSVVGPGAVVGGGVGF